MPLPPSWGGGSVEGSLYDAKDDLAYLLALVPGWALNPDLGLVQPGHTIQYELDVAARVKSIKNRWFPEIDPPVEPMEVMDL